MADIQIAPEHVAQMARINTVGQWLLGERERIAREAALVEAQIARVDAELTTLLRTVYHVETAHFPVHLDTEQGVLTTSEPSAPEPTSAPAPAPAEEE